jgi:hypothetical protein
VIEYALGLLPTKRKSVETPTNKHYSGVQVEVCTQFAAHFNSIEYSIQAFAKVKGDPVARRFCIAATHAHRVN